MVIPDKLMMNTLTARDGLLGKKNNPLMISEPTVSAIPPSPLPHNLNFKAKDFNFLHMLL